MVGFDWTDQGLYESTANLAYSASSPLKDPLLLRGRTSVYRHALPTLAEILLNGWYPQDLLNTYCVGPDQSMMYMVAGQGRRPQLTGTNIQRDGAPAMISRMPVDEFSYTIYEDELFEPTKFTTSSAVTITGTTTLTCAFSSAAIVGGANAVYAFQLDDLVINHSVSSSLLCRVSAVSYTDNTISLVAYSGSALTAPTDFFSGTEVTDKLEIVGNATDLRNSTLPSSRYDRGFRVDGVTVKTHYLQEFTEVWQDDVRFDGKLRFTGDQTNPKMQRRRLDTYYKHLQAISRALIWGKAKAPTSGVDRTSFGGLYESITTNTTACQGGVLTLRDLDEMLIDKLGSTVSSRVLYGFCSMPVLIELENLFGAMASRGNSYYERFEKGFYGNNRLGVIKSHGFEIHLVPLADFDNQGLRTMANLDDAADRRMAGNLFLVDPEAMFLVTGSHPTLGEMMFNLESGIENNEERYKFSKHALRTTLGFALHHQKTSGIITGIRYADSLGG